MNPPVNGDGPAAQPQAYERCEETMAGLSARLKQLRTQRLADEAEAGQLPARLRAIVACRRNRDSGSSPILAQQRVSLEHVWSDVEQLLVDTARVAIWQNLSNKDRDADAADPVARRAWRAIRQTQTAVQEFAAAVNQP